MLKLHPKILRKNGSKEFVVLTYEEYIVISKVLGEAHDLADLQDAMPKEKIARNIPPRGRVKRWMGVK